MKDEIRKINDSIKNFKQFSNENSIKFDKVFKTVKKYIDFTLKTEIQINNYVPNTHIAATFKEVLQACEKENMYPNIYHNIRKHSVDYVSP